MANLDGSGVAVKKWMQGRAVSLGRMETMLPVVQKPPESMQMPLGLSLRMDIITSAVTDPESRTDRELSVSVEKLSSCSAALHSAELCTYHRVAGAAPCLPCSAAWPAPSWPAGSRD